MRSSLPLHDIAPWARLRLLVPALLIVLVATLATLQYRWLGQVSAADRDRRQQSLTEHAKEFADDFDREILRVYLAFQVDGVALDRGDATVFNRAYDNWRDSARYPEMLKAVYFANEATPQAPPRRYDPGRRIFVQAAWPSSLAPVVDRITHADDSPVPLAPVPSGTSPGPIAAAGPLAAKAAAVLSFEQLRHIVATRDPIVPSVPAVVISLPLVTQGPVVGSAPLMSMRLGQLYLVAELNADYLTQTVLPALADRYFPERDADSYRFAIVDTVDHDRVVFTRDLSNATAIDPRQADAKVPLFSLRLDLAPLMGDRAFFTQSFSGRVAGPARPDDADGHRTVSGTSVSIYVDSRGSSGPDVVKFSALGSAIWQLRLQHAAGSLDAAVGAVRRRNLWLSFGILTVLAAGVVLIMFNAQRAQRLAAQQMDFVAAVSHELRTPLAVIRSAAQNLSAGVVHDGTQARQYGDLIETEGRRLTDMVEQVLEYAGLSGNRRLPAARTIDLGDLVRDVAASARPLAEAEGLDETVEVADDLPTVVGDEGAVRRALQNLVTNAIKYGADGRWLGISARRSREGRSPDEVEISVSDRGRGIDAEDLVHIFEPFYRGRHAIDRQIHGNGLGLSLVRRIAEAHGGRVTVQSAPGAGTTFTLVLPAVRPDVAVPPLPEPASEGTSH